MTPESNAPRMRKAHADWLRDKASHFRGLAAGAIPLAVAQDIERLAVRYERLAAALENASGTAARHSTAHRAG
ncbi:MAG: hypothetical protein JO128_05380 [Alphaproteobacteria bacterium]|nr:hypothetical protein [Alphaproteobacteria bacterium]